MRHGLVDVDLGRAVMSEEYASKESADDKQDTNAKDEDQMPVWLEPDHFGLAG